MLQVDGSPVSDEPHSVLVLLLGMLKPMLVQHLLKASGYGCREETSYLKAPLLELADAETNQYYLYTEYTSIFVYRWWQNIGTA